MICNTQQMKDYETKYTIYDFGEVYSHLSNKYLSKCIRNGYYYVTLHDNKKFKIHVLVATHFLKKLDNDKQFIDHIDRNKLNNNISNLRWCTTKENNRNKSLQKNNTSGAIGISFNKKASKFHTYIWNDSKRINIGYFTDFIEALKKRIEVEESLFKEFSTKHNKLLLDSIEETRLKL